MVFRKNTKFLPILINSRTGCLDQPPQKWVLPPFYIDGQCVNMVNVKRHRLVRVISHSTCEQDNTVCDFERFYYQDSSGVIISRARNIHENQKYGFCFTWINMYTIMVNSGS